MSECSNKLFDFCGAATTGGMETASTVHAQLTVRGVDNSLHRFLQQEADRRGLSVNGYVLSLLQEAVGMRNSGHLPGFNQVNPFILQILVQALSPLHSASSRTTRPVTAECTQSARLPKVTVVPSRPGA